MSTLTKAHSLPAVLSSNEQNNELYYGDNLSILRDHILTESIDLVYLDPPFNSNQDYNVLFTEQDGSRAAAQILAFEDTWQWDQVTARTYQETVEAGGKVSEVLRACWTFLGGTNMMAYLAMMAPRLVELHRVLKPTGSIYLHCDPTASHYLKLVMDSIFGPTNFRNEIIWRRSQPKAHVSIRYSRAHDVILFYAKSESAVFHLQHTAHDPEYLEKFYRYIEPGTGRRYRIGDLTNPNKNRPNLTYEFPPGSGVTRVWRWTKERMMKAWEEGIVVIPENGGVAQGKRYLDEMAGAPVTDFWDDIEHLHGTQQESLGYPTQKPEALLERIINASSNEGDIVLDPFCGCGTAISVAEHLHRKWVGIDITHLAIGLIRHRLQHAYQGSATYRVIGEPVSRYDAEALAKADPYEFQWWAAGQVGGRIDKKRGADQGIDGRLFFHDDPRPGSTKQIILSVKSGKIPAAHIRELRGVIEREDAEIGVLLTLCPPTKPMRAEAANAGFYESPWGTKHPRLQIITIEELLGGKGIDYPPSQTNVTHRRAARKVKGEKAQPQRLPYTH